MGKNISFKKYLVYMGISLLGASLGIGGAAVITDAITNANRGKGSDLPLVEEGAHIKAGNHRVVLTSQFCDLLSYNTKEEAQKLVVDSIKLAYNNLNELNSGIKFNLYTTSDNYADKYNISKIDNYTNEDIPLYLTNDYIAGSKYVAATTNFNIYKVSRELCNQSITFRKDMMLSLWNYSGSLEEILTPKNSWAYTITAHESMHLMGIGHIEENSIMNEKLDKRYKDFTELDKSIIDKFNVEFYGTQSKFVSSFDNIEDLSL